MKRNILTLFFVLIKLFCNGQDVIFNHLMTEDGLSENSIFTITQDKRGFMWYGSRFGLNRYDGDRFRLYKNDPKDTSSLSHDYISALYSDTKGTLWVGTINGLNKFNPEKNTFKRIQLAQPETKIPNYIRTINEDKQGRLWVGTNYGLYLLINPNTSKFVRADKLGLQKDVAMGEILCTYQDHQGYLWIGTNHSLIKAKFGKSLTVVSVFRNDGSPTSISDNSVTAITEDLQKKLWFATENGGINLFDRSNGHFTRFLHERQAPNTIAHNAVRRMIRTKSGELWIGTQEGLSIFNPLTKKFRTYQYSRSNPKSLNQNSIHSIYEDLNGSVWIGTYYGGVNVVYALPTRFKNWQHSEKVSSLNHNVVSSVTQGNDERLWIGTEGGGLNYYRPDTQTFGAYSFVASDSQSLGSNLVKVVYKDKKGHIWIGTHGGGLNLYIPETGKFKRFLANKDDLYTTRSEITALLEDEENRLWVGTQSGPRIFNKQDTRLEPLQLPGELKLLAEKNIRFLFKDSKKNIWISTMLGLYLYAPKNRKLQLIKIFKDNSEEISSSKYVNCLYEDVNKNIWAGIYYGGLAMYNSERRIFADAYTIKDGLSNDNVLGILEDNKHQLWISTSSGLSKFSIRSRTFQSYITSDGLAGNDFNYNSFFKNKDGLMFFGGYNGLTYFSPDEIQKNNYQAPVVFTGLLLFNRPVEIGASDQLLQKDLGYTSKLQFKYDQNVFSIQFALLNYIKSKKNKYAYKLEGVNKEWIETSIPAASYTNLSSGNYTLLVKGANNDGVWSKPASIQIEILPPFWKTWWAFCIYALLVAAVIFFITRFFYLRELLIKDEELHQNKLNFFTNVSHEIRTHLTLIMVPVEKLIDQDQRNSFTGKQLANIKNNVDRLLRLTSELMDFRKAETHHLKLQIGVYDLIGFIQEIATVFEYPAEKKNINFSVSYDQDPIELYFDKVQLEKVFFNLISNAFKFTPSGGTVKISIKKVNQKVAVHVEDTGRGIAPEHLNQLFTNFFQVNDYSIQNTGYGIGLALSKHIVELHKGEISVKSNCPGGEQAGYTCFTVSLQTGKLHFGDVPYLPSNTQILSRVPETIDAIQETATGNSRKQAILIVEDNAELCLLIKDSLMNHYDILIAQNGVQGWTKATEEVPDLIVSDVMMPQMDGFTLCGKLKSDERTSHIPVILLTAKSTETDLISGLTGGADVYLTKPFSQKILQLNVRNLLTARAVMRQKFSRQLILEPQQIALAPVEEQFLSRLILIIENNMENEHFGVEQLAEGIGMSQSVLYKKLKALTNMSVNDFAKSIRLKRAAQLLLQKQYTVYEIGYMVGFADRKYFSREFKKQFGKTPSEYMDTVSH